MPIQLTTSQQEAVHTTEPETLVVSAAGSGKTKCLVERIKCLMECGASTDQLMVLTFTNRAAGEMVARLAADLGGGEQMEQDLRRMFIGTFHAVSLKILQQYAHLIGYRPREDARLTILTPIEAEMFVRWVCRRLGFARGKSWADGLSYTKVAKHLEDFYTGSPLADDPNLERIRIEYHHQLRECNCLDFGQILAETQRLLKAQPDVLKLLQDRVKHVLVDEVQDTDRTQYTLHRFFAPPATFFAVGDFRQCAPTASMVRTPTGDVRIETLRDNDPVITFDKHGKTVLGYQGGFRCRRSSRMYRGELVVVSVDGKMARTTPNHKWFIKWSSRATNICVTYLMRKDDRFRVGWCQLFSKGGGGFHLGQRTRLEHAQDVWILGVHQDKTSASIEESWIATEFGLPLMPFHPVNGAKHLTEDAIERFFRRLSPTTIRTRAIKALGWFHRDIEEPLWSDVVKNVKRGRTTCMTISAANLIPGLMMIPVPTGAKDADWRQIDAINLETYAGPVFSLDVDKHHTYIQDGLITCNSIYSWRGARPDLMKTEHPNAYVVELRECFRCGDSIVEAANKLIGNDPDNFAEPMIGATERPGSVELIACDESELIHKIEEIPRGGFWGNIAILARMHTSLDRLEPFLRHAHIPYQRVDARARGLFATNEFVMLHAALKLVCNDHDLISMLILEEELFADDGLTLEACIRESRRLGEPLFRYYLNNCAANYLNTAIASCCGSSPAGPAIRQVFEGFYADDSEPLRHAAAYWLWNCRRMILADALDWFADQKWDKDTGEDWQDRNAITLATVHGVKGLEWATVIVTDFAEERLPSRKSIGAGDIREERRIAYVAMTRPAERLILHQYPESEVSRFAIEAGITECSPGPGGSAASLAAALRDFF